MSTIRTRFETVKGRRNRAYLNRRQFIELIRMVADLRRLERTHVSLEEAARLLGRKANSLTHLIRRGRVRAVRSDLYARVFIDRETLRSLQRLMLGEQILTIPEAADRLSISPSSIWRGVQDGRVQAVSFRRRTASLGIEEKEIRRLRRTYVFDETGYLRVSRVAERLGVTESWVRARLGQRDLPCYRNFRGIRLLHEEDIPLLGVKRRPKTDR